MSKEKAADEVEGACMHDHASCSVSDERSRVRVVLRARGSLVTHVQYACSAALASMRGVESTSVRAQTFINASCPGKGDLLFRQESFRSS